MIARYTLPEMGALWSEEAKFNSWLQVELATAKVQAKMRIIPNAAYVTMKKKAGFTVKRINQIEQEVNHDLIAFTTAVSEQIGPAGKYLHYGLTSSDVVDTALSLQMKRAAEIIDAKIVVTLGLIKKLANKYKLTPCIGRTHGVLAEPTTVGLKFAVWYAELSRGRKRFNDAAKMMSVGKLSGAVGNFANLDPKVEAAVLRELKLTPAEASTQVLQRDRHAAYLTSLAILMSSLEKFATEIRNLQRTEIGEMYEPFSKGQKGSSAMPHKRNPITAERITGLARLVRGYALSSMENVPLWHERDIAHSSVERVIVPDATIAVDYALHKFAGILSGLQINKDRMKENIFFGGGLVFSQRLLLKLTPKLGSRDMAYRMVQRNALRALSERSSFHMLAKADPDITKHLSAAEIDSSFSLAPYTKHVPTIFKRVFSR
jgi:adenylosuccinate lyase